MTTALQTRPIESVGNLLRYALQGVTFPISKTDMLKMAERNGADTDVLQTLDHVSESKYFGITDIMEEILYLDEEEEKEKEATEEIE